jgi:hypothetical protein
MRFRSLGVVAALALASCSRSKSWTPAATTAEATAEIGTAASPAAPIASPMRPIDDQEFGELFRSLSGVSGSFISDNLVSNETSYLQIVRQLALRATPGGAYIGVGPEQNLTYIAVTRPRIAFIVDIRRENALLQLFYKSIFDVAKTRTEFLSLLLGRSYDAAADPGAFASPTKIIAAVRAEQEDPKVFAKQSAALRARLQNALSLSSDDVATLQHIQQQFFDHQLDLHFELNQPNGRHYPSLEELLTEKDSVGRPHGFLATHKEFSTVQQLERQNRVIPVVGNFAGQHALSAIAAELERRNLKVSVFYVSNVEQYLFEPKTWQQWVKNVEALPHDARSLFVRCYLDEGRAHPLQMPGHRTTTVLGYVDRFVSVEHAAGYKSFWQLATDENLR